MKKIRSLTVQFDAVISPDEIPAFRGAVCQKAGHENIRFHNHAADGRVLHQYPVIQYKRIGAHPAIVCLEAGVDEIHRLFEQESWDIRLGGRPVRLAVKDLRMHQYTLQAWEHAFSFRIRDWMALNQENHRVFQTLGSQAERLAFLEKILTSNILSMAKGLDWFVDRPVQVAVERLSPLRLKRFKDQILCCFDADFATNVFLPQHIGLGKGVSHGFGVVTQRREPGKRNPHLEDTQPDHQ